MKLEKWALIAEIIGGIAIVLSLVFVGIEIRRNTNAAYAATYDQILADHIDINLAEANSLSTLNFAKSGNRLVHRGELLFWIVITLEFSEDLSPI